MSSLHLSWAMAVVILAASCGPVPIESENQRPQSVAGEKAQSLGTLDISLQDDQAFKGSYVGEKGFVEFNAQLSAVDRIDVTTVLHIAGLDDLHIRFAADMSARNAEGNYLEWNVEGGTLDALHHDLLVEFHPALVAVLPVPDDAETGDQNRPHEILLRDYTGMLAEAPGQLPNGGYVRHYIAELNRYELDDGSVTGSNGATGLAAPMGAICSINNGVKIMTDCCYALKSKSVTYDNASTCFNRTRQCGFFSGDGCMGRCGMLCATSGWYFKDCLDHDCCVFDLKAWPGPWWGNCADEFSHATDDFSTMVALNLASSWAINYIGFVFFQLGCQ